MTETCVQLPTIFVLSIFDIPCAVAAVIGGAMPMHTIAIAAMGTILFCSCRASRRNAGIVAGKFRGGDL